MLCSGHSGRGAKSWVSPLAGESFLTTEAFPDRIRSGRWDLAAHIAEPTGSAPDRPGLVICHGFPSGVGGGHNSWVTFPDLAERIASKLGWVVLTFTFRGCGDSMGDFSLGGWLDDVGAAVEALHRRRDVRGIHVAGFGTGGALAICQAARDERIRGVAALAAPADFDDWARNPRRLLVFARKMEIIDNPKFPRSFDAWAQELQSIRAVAAVEKLRPRPLLVVHGSEDESVPVFDGRVIGDAHANADLRIIAGAAHHLRHDPRAIATLMGWLERQA